MTVMTTHIYLLAGFFTRVKTQYPLGLNIKHLFMSEEDGHVFALVVLKFIQQILTVGYCMSDPVIIDYLFLFPEIWAS